MINIDDITYRINGAIFEVSKELGPGFLEKVYENALMIELANAGLHARSQVPLNVSYKNHPVGNYFADIVVEGRVLIEIKTVEKLTRIHFAQTLHYLKATGIEIGLLVNFKAKKAEVKRFILSEPRP